TYATAVGGHVRARPALREVGGVHRLDTDLGEQGCGVTVRGQLCHLNGGSVRGDGGRDDRAGQEPAHEHVLDLHEAGGRVDDAVPQGVEALEIVFAEWGDDLVALRRPLGHDVGCLD